MNEEPARPILNYDGACDFCCIWIGYWQHLTGDRVDYQPFQTAADQFPHIPRSAFESAVYLNWPAGHFTFGAQAVFEVLALARGRTGWLWSYRQNPWFINFLLRLLQGSPDVLQLLAKNPFPDHPPRYLRAVLYDYHFTDPATLRSTGAWWRREPIGLYVPPLTLNQFNQPSGN